jgi:hypothetical protein
MFQSDQTLGSANFHTLGGAVTRAVHREKPIIKRRHVIGRYRTDDASRDHPDWNRGGDVVLG